MPEGDFLFGNFHFHSWPRDPNLSRKPTKTLGRWLVFEKNDGWKEWLESTPRTLVNA